VYNSAPGAANGRVKAAFKAVRRYMVLLSRHVKIKRGIGEVAQRSDHVILSNISLSVSPHLGVPVPAAVWLFGSAMLGVIEEFVPGDGLACRRMQMHRLCSLQG
jgi:hypothetical protein